jgi:DNA polymerase-3 subunit gamma/tau
MLSGHSFNALLKTLEEPPPHVKFLLATTDPQKLPPTILSRCLQFNLRALQVIEIVSQMEKILKSEAVEFDIDALNTLARAAAGSMRDGLSLLDQSIAFGSGTVAGGAIRDMLGMIETRQVEQLIRALVEADVAALLDVVEALRERALDYRLVLDDLLVSLHDICLYQIAPDAVDAKALDAGFIAELSELITPEDVQLFYQIGLLGKADLPLAPDPATGFEMALLRMLLFRPDTPDGEEDISGESETLPAKRSPVRVAANKKRSQSDSVPKSLNPAEPSVWARLVGDAALEGVSRELAMNLSPQTYESGTLTVGLSSALQHLDKSTRRQEVEKKIGALLGEETFALQVVKASTTSDVATPVAVQAKRTEEAKQQAYNKFMQDPVVQDIIDRFDATVFPDSVRTGQKGG